jgi:hypothetical protein
MSDGEALRATIACADVPDGVDREATLHALRAALAETQRIEVVEAPSPAAATLHVRWRLETPRWAGTPQAVVSLVLCDAVGAELERHEIGAAPAHIPSAVEHAALGFARPERYREIMEARGAVGRVLHPSERDLDPLDARALALAAALCWPFADLPTHADRFVRVARATGRYEHVLDAVDLHDLRGDLDAARCLLADASLLALDGAPPAAAARSHGLAIREHLGDTLAPLLLCGGAAMARRRGVGGPTDRGARAVDRRGGPRHARLPGLSVGVGRGPRPHAARHLRWPTRAGLHGGHGGFGRRRLPAGGGPLAPPVVGG